MIRSQFWLLALCSWLFALYNIERLSKPINLASFVYVFVIVSANLVILVRGLRRLPFYKSLLLFLPPYFFLKVYLGYEIAGTNLPITVTEICAIGLTLFLTQRVTWHLEEFRDAISRLTIGRLEEGTHRFEEGQGHIYREVRRARLYKRPAALLAIAVDSANTEVEINRFIKEAQNEIIRRYIAARTASLLVDELKDSDVITKRNDHFIVLLPESDREIAAEIAERLTIGIEKSLGLNCKIGFSTFPDDAVTFESLLVQAESSMNRAQSDPEEPSESLESLDGNSRSQNGSAKIADDDVKIERKNQWNNES